jgi:hypothetical protein
MRDFDVVLERLLTEPSFQQALAADPVAALRPYELSDEEQAILRSQVDTGPGADHTVEMRANKSGVVGLLGPMAAAFGVAASGGRALGSAPLASESVGSSGGDHREAIGAAAPDQTVGQAPRGDSSTLGSAPVRATDYHTRVDVDGDGTWDRHIDYERADGGVDITADMNNDGVVDFVGHDVDRDGRVDFVDYDHDFDGVMDTRMYDDTGDGWLDRSEPLPRPTGSKGEGATEALGPAVP